MTSINGPAEPVTEEAKRLRDLEAEVERLRESEEEYHRLTGRLSDLLTATANALKGDPGRLQQHSWHDLAEVAASVVARAESAEAVARAAADLAKHERTLRDNTVPVREHIAAQDGQRAAWRVLFAALDQWKGQP